MDKPNTYNGYSSDISFFIQWRTLELFYILAFRYQEQEYLETPKTLLHHQATDRFMRPFSCPSNYTNITISRMRHPKTSSKLINKSILFPRWEWILNVIHTFNIAIDFYNSNVLLIEIRVNFPLPTVYEWEYARSVHFYSAQVHKRVHVYPYVNLCVYKEKKRFL